MRIGLLAVAATASLALSACGGGGGGVASTPTPPPAPTPAPTNTAITDLRVDQTFTSEGASTGVSIDRTSATVSLADNLKTPVQVRYDAATRSYTVQTQGRSQTFAPGDLDPSSNADEARYFKDDGTARDFLTLVLTPFTSSTPNRYVAQAFWQRNISGAGTQETTLDSFVYGFETPAAAVPRSGSASYRTDSFGFVATPGKAPKSFVGQGAFNLDLGLSVFNASSSVEEYDLVTGGSVSGGGIELIATGKLGSGNGFSGNFTYGGFDGSVSGTIAGRFYGPNGQELGASFAADNAAGAAVSGSMTGVRDDTLPRVNLSLTNLTTEQLFYASQAIMTVGNPGPNGQRAINNRTLIGQFTLRPDGSFILTPGTSELPFVTASATDRIAGGPANFTIYETLVDGRTVRVELYRPGGANTELALTYAGFGSWSGNTAAIYTPANARYFFTYGLSTPREILARRTGTASYNGIVHGAGARNDGATYAVGGTSRFDVDFTSQRFSGALNLNGAPSSGGASESFGTWTFADRMFSGLLIQTQLIGGPNVGNCCNQITPGLYGPDGEEIAATFALLTGAQDAAGTVSIVGATVAKR